MFATQDSVVRESGCNTGCILSALLVTLQDPGFLLLPCLHISSLYASNPTPTSDSLTLLMITAPSSPAFCSVIWCSGASSALRITDALVFISLPEYLPVLQLPWMHGMYADPPPATMPSSTAALVAFRASSMRSFAFFHLCFGSCTDTDHCYAACQFRKSLLQFFLYQIQKL